jgi:anti-sigma B factor antagonist
MNLQLSTRILENETAVIEVAGELESANCDDLREEILGQVNAARSHLVIDLREVTFIDSTGLGVLVGGLKKMRESNGRFSLVCAQPRILRILEISGLVRVFSVHANAEEAMGIPRAGEEEL